MYNIKLGPKLDSNTIDAYGGFFLPQHTNISYNTLLIPASFQSNTTVKGKYGDVP